MKSPTTQVIDFVEHQHDNIEWVKRFVPIYLFHFLVTLPT